MPQPPAYTPATDFSEEELLNAGGRSTVGTADLDAELAAIAATLAAIRTNLSMNQRDDGEIRDQRVKLHTLASDVLALLTAYGSTARGAWVTATAYAMKDLVSQGGNTYICVTAHTSGVFATDLAAVKWLLFALGTTPAASSIPFTPTAMLASTNVQAAIEESDTENRALSAAAQALAATMVPLASLASTASAAVGAGLGGFSRALAYVANTIGWGIRQAENAHNVLRWITPSLWAAILDGTTTTDVSTMVQAAIDEIAAAGGGALYIPGVVVCNTPLRLVDGVDLIGCGRNHARIKKDSTTTKAVAVVAGALVVYGGATLPANINAILVLDGAGGRYTGRIADITLEGTLTTAGNYETQKVEFGIVSVGSVSDYTRERVSIISVQYAELYPVIFASELRSARWSTCLRGLSIDNGTSTQIVANYANDCRDWGYFIRDLKYSEITGNACDNLNDPAKYPTRTRTCSAYKLRTLLGCVVTDNGDEQTYGRSIDLDEFDRSLLEHHTTIDIGSDYTGADQIAWIYSSDIMRGSIVRNNFAYGVKSGGLTYGGAVAGQHHNIYFTGLTNVAPEFFGNNLVAATRTSVTEAGWGNNVPTTWLNAGKGGAQVYTHSPTLSAQTPGNLAVVYGADNAHFVEQKGALRHVWGCFHVTVTHTTASGLLVIEGFPTNGSKMSAIVVTGVAGGSGLAVKLGWFEMAAAATGAVGRSDGDVNFTIADLPTGTQVRIFYDGWYQAA